MKKHIYKEPLIVSVCFIVAIIVLVVALMRPPVDQTRTVDHQTPLPLIIEH